VAKAALRKSAPIKATANRVAVILVIRVAWVFSKQSLFVSPLLLATFQRVRSGVSQAQNRKQQEGLITDIVGRR
jgi:hypothetical protein